MTTTIQLHSKTKAAPVSPTKESETCKRINKKLLIEGYKETAEESLKICKEFDVIEPEWPEY